MYRLEFPMLLIFLGTTASGGAHEICLDTVHLQIKDMHPPIHLASEVQRKPTILLRTRVDCATGRSAVPASANEAVDWLDVALPLDFKQGLVRGEYFNPYVSTQYGASVEDDLFEYFSNLWNLGEESPICGVLGPSEQVVDEQGCFSRLLDWLRDAYRQDETRPVEPSKAP